MNVERGFQLQDLRAVLARRASLIAGVAFGVFLLSIVIAFWLPNQYSASTMLLVEPQVISKEILKEGTEKSNLNQRLHIMTAQILSRGRLSRVIDDLKLYPSESQRWTREQVIDYMRKRIRVEPVLPELEQGPLRRAEYDINTFKLFFVSDTAEVAANVANRLANDFIEEHLKERVQVSGDTSEFIEAELGRLNSRIQQVDTRIADLKAENVGRLPEDLQANQTLLERAIDSLRAVQRDLAVAESDEAFFKQQALMSPGLPTLGNETSPGARREILHQQLEEYRGRGYTDEYPDVVAAKEQLKEIEKRMGGGAGPGTPLSLPQQNAESESRRAAIRIESAQEEVKRLNTQIDDLQKKIADTPGVQQKMDALELELKQLGESYRDFSAKRLEANVAANMERRQKGEQFRILEAAVPPVEPSSPHRALIVLLGLVLGLAISSGVGLLAESADTSFHGASDLQAAFRIPVLAAIPAILLDADRVLRRRRRMRRLWYAAAVGGVVFVVAAGGYAYNNGFPFRSRGAPEEKATPSLPAAPVPAPPAEGTNVIPAPAPPAVNNPTPAPAPGGGDGKG
jgi:polysaccharide chain length determinant protein (PEP-CTERM system associated)